MQSSEKKRLLDVQEAQSDESDGSSQDISRQRHEFTHTASVTLLPDQIHTDTFTS